MKAVRAIGAVLLALGALNWCDLALAQEALKYQKRTNRYEGVRPKPVSGFDIELLSARVDFRDRPEQVGERFFARFFLMKPSAVHLVVRELDYKHYYWLDKVEPKTPWQAGYNSFDWPTGDVIKQLKGLTSDDLGVVARLEKAEPAALEKVAPIVLSQSRSPAEIKAYLFAFRLRDDARVKAKIYPASGPEAIFGEDLGKQRGGRPFTVKWALADQAGAGDYKLVLSGYVLSTNDPISQIVQFYHQPHIK